MRDGLPVGNVVIRGRPGIGKSHFLGRVRHAVIEQRQVFVPEPARGTRLKEMPLQASANDLQVDQLDGLIALGRSLDGAEEQSLIHEVANGLMDLAEDVQHSLIVLRA